MTASDSDKNGERKRDKVEEFLTKNFNKGELALKHAAGLGHVPNAVPLAQPSVKDPARPVEVGWHPVGGFAGKWFAEETGLGKMITERVNKYPDPTQHWAVLVGDYAHQLWMDENFDVIYTNERVERQEWRTFKVGETRFNDDATRRAGEHVIQCIREKQPAYNLITNNCQTYALQLLDAIKVGGHKEFGTTLAVYERLTGSGKVTDLFPKLKTNGAADENSDDAAQGQEEDTVSVAQTVMASNTTQLDTKEEMKKHEKMKHDGENGSRELGEGDEMDEKAKGKGKKKKKSILTRWFKN